ncbi:hypothetical protein [Gordonia sp. SL306]|uniref:hypothetical protein n=1 Tax=Gordonia sp. SL306 TaxID=2995145 RepID=UPI00227201C2|nr:hypothetical protein [Gordonia sp. SL306]WAC57073.1 hypothetical protein OVA31_07455 [Gordonia sp. SL306]
MRVDDVLATTDPDPSRAFVLPDSVPATPAITRFVAAMRRMQDLARAAQADDTARDLAAEQIEADVRDSRTASRATRRLRTSGTASATRSVS